MQFHSMDFLIFFPLTVFVYFIIPKKARYLFLLAASYYFYMCWNARYAFLLAASTLITYGCALLVHREESETKRKLWLALNCAANLSILFVFKYSNFAVTIINKLMSLTGGGTALKRLDLLLPVGISFYTFQALGYTFDVYQNRIEPERNLFRYALFVSFFPQLAAGPIGRAGSLLPQLHNCEMIRAFDLDRIRHGVLLMLWGYFQKLVIADRAALLVDQVTAHYRQYGFVEITAAVILFAIQIYCDFGGYSNIARGAAKIMGFDLMVNFKQPYLARNIKDFWRRWHISLTSWFTDYLYIPLGGSRKGELRTYLNILIVFAVSGLWHGARLSFIAWGMIHAFYQICGRIREKRSGEQRSDSPLTIFRNTVITFVLTDFAWIFFMNKGLRNALGMIRRMCTVFRTTGFAPLKLHPGYWFCLNGGIVILLIVDLMHEKQISVFDTAEKQQVWIRWSLYFLLLWVVLMLGIYGPAYDTGSFIYFQF